MTEPVDKSEQEWRQQLSAEQYHIMREKGTERPFTGRYWDNHDEGMYRCAGCGTQLFRSDTKFESGSGWPSFYEPTEKSAVKLAQDDSHGMRRTEVLCAVCDSHLGHVFPDGPKPTGLRYCINSACLAFEPEAEK